MWSRAIAGVLLVVAIQVSAQDRETVLFDFDAYNPVPSPDGKLIAYDLTGRKLTGGSGGFGRSNLLSQVEFSDLSGNNRRNPNVEGFLGEWLPDSSAIATYRAWQFALLGPDGIMQHGAMPKPFFEDRQAPAERAAYLPTLGEFVWIGCEDIGTAQQRTVLQTNSGPIASLNILLPTSGLIVPSPDGRYLAVGNLGPYLYEDPNLWVFDTEMQTWTNLGSFTIHPDPEWDYIKPSWNPWFSDSRHLAFFSGYTLYVVSPNGKQRRKVLDATNAGLAIPSPDGSLIAFIMSIPRPRKGRPDLSFWGGSSISVVPSGGGKAVAITKPSDDETYDLRWLSNSSLVFDRIGDGLFNKGARIWTVPVALK
jgi:Tol biopolymer transport system component